MEPGRNPLGRFPGLLSRAPSQHVRTALRGSGQPLGTAGRKTSAHSWQTSGQQTVSLWLSRRNPPERAPSKKSSYFPWCWIYMVWPVGEFPLAKNDDFRGGTGNPGKPFKKGIPFSRPKAAPSLRRNVHGAP